MKIHNCFSSTQLRITTLRKYPIDPKTYLGRCIDKWNNLTDDNVNSSTVLSFKTMYDRYIGDQKYHTGDIY